MSDDVRISAQLGTRSVDRAVSLMQLLAQRKTIGLGEIARALSIPKSSAKDVLRALVARHIVIQDSSGRYCLGLGVFEIGVAYLRTMTPIAVVEPELAMLARVLSATSLFAVLDAEDIVVLARHNPAQCEFEGASALGARIRAATTALGKAQLAFVSTRDTKQPGYSSHFVEFTRIRALGYALDGGDSPTQMTDVAAPVFAKSGCCGAIGVSALVDGDLSRESVIDAVVAAATHVTLQLGGVRPYADALKLGRTLSRDGDQTSPREVLR
jgi:DNA-binding IclR family transcriptional regulator